MFWFITVGWWIERIALTSKYMSADIPIFSLMQSVLSQHNLTTAKATQIYCSEIKIVMAWKVHYNKSAVEHYISANLIYI